MIATNRHPGSFVAGGIALNQYDFRRSNDIDIFQDNEKALLDAFDADKAALVKGGLSVKVTRMYPTFVSAQVSNSQDTTEVEWSVDSAFRFFPPMHDAQLGYKLHPLDLATNKALAAGGRREARDIIDLINLDKHYLCLGAIVWAAVAKDPGFSPSSLLENISRFSAHSDAEYSLIDQINPITAVEAKAYLLDAMDRARAFLDTAPVETIGHSFLNAKGRPCQPAPGEFGAYRMHAASLGGIWPSIRELDSRLIRDNINEIKGPGE